METFLMADFFRRFSLIEFVGYLKLYGVPRVTLELCGTPRIMPSTSIYAGYLELCRVP